LEFDPAAFEDLAWWIQQDRNKALRIVALIREVQRDPFKGIGKPEPLKHALRAAGRVVWIKNTASSIKSLKTKLEFSLAAIIIEVSRI